MKKILSTALCLILAASLFACGKGKDSTNDEQLSYSSDAVTVNEGDSAQSAESSTTQEAKAVADEEEKVNTYIILNDDSTTINGSGASFSNGTVSITKGGVYSLKGKLSDGSIRVNTDEDKKVKLMLDGVEISSSSTAPIYVENSNKETKLVLMNGTKNVISDSAGRTTDETDPLYANAAIYSRDDLEICGSGELSVDAKFEKGIFSKNDLQISSGKIGVTAVDDALRGKDSVEISGGELSLVCGGDGIRTNNSEEDGKGSVVISGGSINITSDGDGLQATADISLSGGEIYIKTVGGSTSDIKSSAPAERFGGYNGFGNAGAQQSTQPADESSSTSTKALKADGKIILSGGSIDLDSYDDAIHADGNVEISSSSTISISTNDDAIHSDKALSISGGKVRIAQSYEGLEAESIEISGGDTVVNAADDGVNASTASEQSENPYSFGGKGGGGNVENDGTSSFVVSGGRLVVNSSGDGIDSNGEFKMTGGFVVVFGPTNNGNGSIDVGSASVTGGTLLAVGSSGMAEGLGEDSSYIFTSASIPADTLVSIGNSSGKELIAFVTPKNIENIIFFDSSMKEGDSFTVSTGGTHGGEQADGIYTEGDISGASVLSTVTASSVSGRGDMRGGMPGGAPRG